MAIINDKLKHFGKFDKSNIKLQPKCFFVLSYDCCKCSRNCFQWIHITKSFSAPGFDEAFKYKKQHIAAKDFSRRFRTIIQGYEERVWMEFDIDFIKLPKPSEHVVYDCGICEKSQAVTCRLFAFTNTQIPFYASPIYSS